MFPDELEVTVTAKHLNDGSRTDPEAGPLALAVAEELGKLGITVKRVKIREEDVIIWEPGRIAHSARYWMSDEAWKLNARHAEGRRVKPKTVTLTVIYKDRNVTRG